MNNNHRLGVLCLFWGAGMFPAWGGPPVRKISPHKDYLVTIKTGEGRIRLVLSEKTPRHRENFIRLAKEGFYDGLLFHRVIQGFMIQGGDPESRNAPPGRRLGDGDCGKRIPAEIVPELFHRRGAIAAARDNNPSKASSACQFYIVQGRRWNREMLQQQVKRAARQPTKEQRRVYLKEGGAPHLDGAYTVFGQVVDGMEAVDRIASLKGDARARPGKDVVMRLKVSVWKKKKITRKYNYSYSI